MKKIGVGIRQKNNGLWASLAFGLLALAALSTSALAQENRAESWYKSGQELEKIGSWQEALDAYDQAIKLNPEYEAAWCAKCKALSNVNLELSGEEQNITFTDAIQACDKALDIDPKSAGSWSGKGFVFYQEFIVTADPGKLNESLQAYEKAIEVADSDTSALAEAWQGKGTALSQMSRSDEALAAQEKAIELNGSDVEAWMGKAMALSKLGRDEEAVQAYDRIFELYPSEDQRVFDYPYIWYSKGRALEKLGREEEAAHAYNKSVEDVDTIIGWVASGRDFYMNLSEAWQYKGQLLEEQGRYEQAVEALDNATKADPLSIRDWNLKGFFLASELGRYNESLQAYDRALEIDSEDAGALVGKGSVLRSLSRYQEAGELYDSALEIVPQLPQNNYQLAKARYGKGEVQKNQGRNDEVLKSYDKAIDLDPRYPQDARIGRAMVLESMGRHEEAVEAYNQSLVDYERITKNNPKKSYVWYGKGNALQGLGRYNESLQAYNKAIELNPRYIDAWLNKGYALDTLALEYGLSDPENFTKTLDYAILAFDNAIEIYPENSVAWSKKGFSLSHMGPLNHTRYNESISAYDRAIKLNPKNAEAWLGKGAVLSLWAGSINDKSLYEGAVKAFDRVIELNPQQTAGRVSKANVLLNLGRYNESLEILDEALEAASQDTEKAQIWIEKAHFFAEQGNYNETAKALEKASLLDPKEKELWINGGVLLSAVLSRNDEALKYYERALQIDPADSYAWYAKGEAFKALGRQAEADAAYAKARTMGYSAELQLLQALPVVTNVTSLGDDEFIELANNENASQEFRNLRLIADGDENKSIVLPDFTLEPGQKIRIHFGRGESNQTDFFLGSEIDLNDTAGNLTLRDSIRGIEKGYMEYWTSPAQETAEDWLKEGRALERIGDWEEALRAYDKAINLTPVNSTQKLAGVWEQKAYALANLGDMMRHDQALFEESVRAYDRAIELDPGRASARTGKAAILATRLNRADEAVDVSRSAVDLNIDRSLNDTGETEDLIRALEVQGQSQAKAGKYEEAAATYDRLLEIASQDSYAMSFAWQGKGNALFGMKMYEEAISAYDRAIETYPSNMDGLLSTGIWEGKGDALEAMGKHEEAVEAYDQAIEAHPKNAPVIYKNAQILEALCRNSDADAAFTKAKELGGHE